MGEQGTTSKTAAVTPVPHGGDEWAGPDDRCSCGRPAMIVYLTERFGRVGYCDIENAKPLSGRFDDPVVDTRDDRPRRGRRREGGGR
jgi:hypothetical protein